MGESLCIYIYIHRDTVALTYIDTDRQNDRDRRIDRQETADRTTETERQSKQQTDKDRRIAKTADKQDYNRQKQNDMHT